MSARGLIALLLLPGLAPAASFGSHGTAGADFTKILAAPRPAAMGGAGVALGEALSNTDLNPAALAGLSGVQADATHALWLQDIALDRVSLAWGRRQGTSLALSYLQMGTPDMPAIDASGVEQGSIRQSDRSLGLGAAWALGRVDLGLAVRGLQRELAGLSQSGVEGDVGARLRLGAGWTLGVSGQHLGSLSAMEIQADPTAMTLRGGLGWDQALGDNVEAAVAVDGVQAVDSAMQVRAGAEVRIHQVLSLRAGSQFSDAFDSRQAFTAGLGLRWQGLGVDYAWAPFGALGNTHRIGLSWTGSPAARARRVPAPASWLEAKREGEGVVLSWDGSSAPRWALYLKKGAQEELSRVAEAAGPDPKVRLKRWAADADVVYAVAPIDPELGEGARSTQLVLEPGRPHVRVVPPPAPPRNLRVFKDAGSARLVWDAPEGADVKLLYQAYVSNRSDAGFQTLGGLNSLTERTVNLKTLKRRVYLTVRARRSDEGGQLSEFSEKVSVEP